MSGQNMLRRLAALVVACYPHGFRERFADEMHEHIVVHGSEARARGPLALGTFLLGLGFDTVRCSCAAHIAELTGRPQRSRARHPRPSLNQLVSSVLADGRFALRSMKRTKALSLAAILTLTLGIGANTAMFSVVRGVVLKPLAFPEPERIVDLAPGSVFSAEQIAALAKASNLSAVTALGVEGLVLRTQDDAREIRALYVDGKHFATFGVRPALGRELRDSDSRPGAEPVVLLGHGFWMRHFGGDLDVIGKTLDLSGAGASERRVVGILPADYRGSDGESEMMIPHRLEPGSHDYRDNVRFWAIGRLADGVALDSAQRELRDLVDRHAATGDRVFNEGSARSLQLMTYREARVGKVGQQLWLLLGVVVVILLISCANVANLLLARSAARTGEISVRRALGAGRERVVRQLLTESLILGVIGGASGVVLAALALPLLIGALPQSLPRAGEIELDGLVLAFSVLVSLVASTAFGLAPALRLARPGESSWRRVVGARSASVLSTNRVLVALQLALSVVLVSCCGLLIRSLDGLQAVEAGFETRDLYSLRVSPPVDTYPEEEDLRRYYRQLLESVRAQPSVESAGTISNRPLSRSRLGVGISPDGAPVPDREAAMMVSYRVVSTDTFRAMKIPLLEGRDLSDEDKLAAAPSGVVNAEMARRLWPDESAVGQRVFWPDGSFWFTVVGVVGNVRQADLATDVVPLAYVAYEQESWVRSLYVMARARQGADLLSEMRQAVRAVDPFVPIVAESSMDSVRRRSLATPRFHALFFSWFSALALVLSSTGLYGITAHQVARRTAEYGVRMTFGASVLDLITSVVRTSLWQIGLGVTGGALLAVLATRWLSGMLHEVSPLDPLVLFSSIAGLSLVALVVTVLGAGRAAVLEPLSALRSAE